MRSQDQPIRILLSAWLTVALLLMAGPATGAGDAEASCPSLQFTVELELPGWCGQEAGSEGAPSPTGALRLVDRSHPLLRVAHRLAMGFMRHCFSRAGWTRAEG